jgi:GDPmannose 4,6-dehydratase
MSNKCALVTGAGGQDGFYLARRLVALGYEVHGQIHNSGPIENVHCHTGDLTDAAFVDDLLSSVIPDEIYNLAATSPRAAWESAATAELNALAPHRICAWIARNRPGCRLFQASSSDIFGTANGDYQNEETPCIPRSPYGVAKLYAGQIVRIYRQQYGLHACVGILFNHESPRRPLSYVSQKIAHAAAALSLGIAETAERDETGAPIVSGRKLRLGNLDIRRDFGFAGDHVEAIRLILQHATPDDYVVGTGETHSVREFCETAFGHVGLDWREHVVVDPQLLRKVDSLYTRADSRKLRETLGWLPTTGFGDLVRMMVDARVRALTDAPST